MDDRIFQTMSRISNREKILSEGLRVVHQQGFGGASVRDIISAAGVPQGSFTNHFASKEAFGLEILNLYFAHNQELVGKTLLDETQPPLDRLRKYVASVKAAVEQNDMKTGCMLGNFSAEATNCDGVIRTRLAEIFSELRNAVTTCLLAAVTSKALPAAFNAPETAGFIVSSLQGAILLSKAHRNIAPIEQFEHILFSKVLT